MAKSRILDADGNPIELAVLTEVHARASLTGVRQVWGQTAATGLTPAGLASLLQAAADGSPNDYLTLAEEMEERDPHYASVLRTRKLAVIGLEPVVEAAGDDAKSQAQAEAVRTLIANPHFETLLEDALDGLGKGYSANEIMWDKGSTWTPKHYEWRDPRWFSWDRITRQQLRLLTEANPSEGEALAPYKFVVHRPKLKSGLPVRAGLARIVAFCWICKAYALKDWMAFIEVFGMPLRLGRYGPGAKPEDIAVLRTAVASIGTDAAAVLPTSMAIEFQKAGEGGGNSADLYLKLCEYLDKQVSKAVLGQTSSSDSQASGLSNGNNQGHNEVRADLLKADAKQLATTINRDLMTMGIELASSLGYEVPDTFAPDSFDDWFLPADELTHAVDVSAFIDAKRDSMAAHASQATSAADDTRSIAVFLSLPDEYFTLAFGTEWFVDRSRPAGIDADDIFAGLPSRPAR